MANDVSYFKVSGDSTTYQFNDPDVENRIGALESTVNDQAGDIADNTTAINTNASAISQLNSKFTSYLPTGTNIDDWDTTGFWLYQRTSPRSHTGTFPYSDSYGTLIHVQGTSTNVAMQMIRSNSIGKSYSTLYVRFKDSTWGSWFKYEDNSKWVVETKTLSVPNVASGATQWVTSSIAKSGYTAVGAVGWYFAGGTANSFLFPYSMRVVGNNSSVAVRNLGIDASSGVSLQIDVLYQKT